MSLQVLDRVAGSDVEETGRHTVSRRQFLQAGTGALVLPALYQSATASPASAKGSKAQANPDAILQFGEMQALSLDPIRMTGGVDYYQLFAVYDTLFSYTTNGTITPRLATSYTASPGKLRVNLRTGVKFQDGTPLDASAVQFSLNRVLHDPNTTIASTVSMIDSVDVVNANTIDINLTQDAIGPLLFQLADRPGMIVSPTAVQAAGSAPAFSTKPVGAGPYAIDGPWFPFEKMSVRRWSGYWDKSAQTLGGVDFTNVIESSRAAALRAGTMDVCTGLLSTDYQVLKSSSGVNIKTGPGLTTYALSINTTKPPFDKLEVRRAVSIAINRVSMNQALTSGLGTPAYQFAAPNSPAYVASLNKMFAYSSSKAQSYLRQAGASDVTFTCLTTTTAAAFYDTAELLQSQLKQAGITMNLQLQLQTEVLPFIWGTGPTDHGTAQSALLAGGLHVTGLDLACRNQCLPTGSQNPGGVNVPGALALINEAASAKTNAASAAAYQKLNTIMTQGVYNNIPLYIGPNITGYGNYVGGNPMPNSDNPTTPDFLRGLYITKGKKPA